MMLTLAWKELREHLAIWLTMVVMTSVLGVGLARLVAAGDPVTAMAVSALSILGMAGAYGVVCGAMMLAGEHEGGTLVFLDIFLGQRHVLWLGKFVIGAALALTEALAVAVALFFLHQVPPTWAPALIGSDAAFGQVQGGGTRAELWLLVLPVVTLEAYAWGLFGSALSRRPLTGAAIAAIGVAPVWLIAVSAAPPPVFLALRLIAAFVALLISYVIFFNQSREAALGPVPAPDEGAESANDPRRRFIAKWEEYERADGSPRRTLDGWPDDDIPVVEPVSESAPAEAMPVATLAPRPKRRRKIAPAGSPTEALAWLTFQQARTFCLVAAGLAIVVGFFLPANGQVLWPLATLLLGVACGVAAFAPEQRDLSYQFLATQHLPLRTIWRFKIGFWLTAAVLLGMLSGFSGLVVLFGRFMLRLEQPGPAGHAPFTFQFGTLGELLGSTLFFTVWLVYGFCGGQVFVWLCRKSILAVLLGAVAAAVALGLWLPSLLCRGMSGWQLWVPPLLLLAATHVLVRAWAGGSIKERRPMAILIGWTLAALAWIGMNLGYRAFEVADVGAPLDPIAFKATVPSGRENVAGAKLQEAIVDLEQVKGGDAVWLERIAEVARLPVGVIEIPRSDGHAAELRHLPTCERMADGLRKYARASAPTPAIERLTQMLALSRNMRSKAPLASYLAGVRVEASALEGVDELLARGKPAPANLRRLLDELNHHAAETPPPLDCLHTECLRAGGLVLLPNLWAYAVGGQNLAGAAPEQRIPEKWLAGAITLSFEMPWEEERKMRLWRLVWAGLLRGIETPYWELPPPADPGIGTDTTQRIMREWVWSDTSPSPAEVARLLDASWLSDERLFCPIVPLRTAGNRARQRVDGMRLAVALALYQLEHHKAAEQLADLVPKYLPQLPIDPYSGKSYRYRISEGEHVEQLGFVRAGQALVWSVGPDREDNGGRADGATLPDDDAPQWQRESLDLITLVPYWP